MRRERYRRRLSRHRLTAAARAGAAHKIPTRSRLPKSPAKPTCQTEDEGGRYLLLSWHHPNQSSHARSAKMSPIDVQTKSWYGRTLESPVATKTARAMIATRMPKTAQNIQYLDKATNKTKDGAPLEHPPKVNEKIGAGNTLACSLGERIKLPPTIAV